MTHDRTSPLGLSSGPSTSEAEGATTVKPRIRQTGRYFRESLWAVETAAGRYLTNDWRDAMAWGIASLHESDHRRRIRTRQYAFVGWLQLQRRAEER